MVRNVVRRNKGLSDRKLMHPAREWILGLFFMVICIGAGAAYSAYSYAVYDDGEYNGTDIEQTLITYRTKQVEDAIAKYNEEKKEHQTILGANITTSIPQNTEESEQTATTSEEVLPEDPSPTVDEEAPATPSL